MAWLGAEEMRAWRGFIDGSQQLMAVLNRELQSAHDMSLAEYRILVMLSESTDGSLRMSDLGYRNSYGNREQYRGRDASRDASRDRANQAMQNRGIDAGSGSARERAQNGSGYTGTPTGNLAWPIPGATTTTYTPVADDAGRKLAIRRRSGAVEWEKGDDRLLFVADGPAPMRVELTWREGQG